jgi:hypothetical protein
MESADMPFTKRGIRPDIIMNPNAVPSRMTIGQLWECLVGKIGAISGMNMDGTSFEDYDLTALKNMLEKLGYSRECDEYLYNGMTGKKMKHMIFIGPTYYQRLKHLVQDKIHCVHSDTDVLTSDGWKNVTVVTKNDLVATLVDGRLEYANPLEVLAYPDYEGPMYYFKNDSVDLAVTGNHRMWISKLVNNDWADFDFERADQIVGKCRKYKKSAVWTAEDYQFVLPEMTIDGTTYSAKTDGCMDAWLTIIGIFHVGMIAGYRKGEIQLYCPRETEYELCMAFTKLNCKYYIKENVFHCIDEQLCNYFAPVCQYETATKNRSTECSTFRVELPDWVLRLSCRQTQKLIEMITMKQDGKYGYACLMSDKLNNADVMQQLCLHAGWSCELENCADTKHKLKYTICWITKDNVDPIVNDKSDPTKEEQLVVEKCPVYCLTVPSGVFYVRRNGKAVWTGNSRSRGPVTILTRQAPEGM